MARSRVAGCAGALLNKRRDGLRRAALSPPRRAGIMRAMARLVFTPQLRRFLAVPDVLCDAPDLRGALQQAFAQNPRLGPYVRG